MLFIEQLYPESNYEQIKSIYQFGVFHWIKFHLGVSE